MKRATTNGRKPPLPAAVLARAVDILRGALQYEIGETTDDTVVTRISLALERTAALFEGAELAQKDGGR